MGSGPEAGLQSGLYGNSCTYVCICTGPQERRANVRAPGCALCRAYAVAVGVIEHLFFVACIACAGVIWVDVIKQYAHMHGHGEGVDMGY